MSQGHTAGEGLPAKGIIHGKTRAAITSTCISRWRCTLPGGWIKPGDESMKGA
ncbi:MAG: hypothetical protein ACK4VX_00395 [Polaromonas sp.]